MAISQENLYHLISQSFPDAKIEITDLAGDNDHYSVKITDQSFLGKSRIEQHKMVNNALKDCLGGQLHALQIKTAS